MMYVWFKRSWKWSISSQLFVKNTILWQEYQITVKNDLKVADLAMEMTIQSQNNFSSS